EFKSRAEVRERFGVVRDMIGAGPWAPGEPTDDTAMACCVAEVIIANPADPCATLAAELHRWARTARDVGPTVTAAMARFETLGDALAASQTTAQAQSTTVADNGSLVRVLPIVLAYRELDTARLWAARQSAITHWQAEAEACVVLYVTWIHELLADDSPRRAWSRAVADTARWASDVVADSRTHGPRPLTEDFWRRFETAGQRNEDMLQPSGYATGAVECLEAAVWSVLHYDSFESRVVAAINLAGDADSIGALTGGAAGAIDGLGAIPTRWHDVLVGRERLSQLADALTLTRR
ncbi:MAG: ADP-ribosylglycohydrolase family protein, partial [Acidobacteriota bacterium]